MDYFSLIAVADLRAELNSSDIVVVDCRFSLQDKEKARHDYIEAHIPGAYYAHLDDDLSGPIIPGETGRHPLPSIEKAVNLFSQWGIDETKQVVVYDQKSGAIAARLWWMLKWLGHDKVAVLEGGWNAWTKENLPVSNISPAIQNSNFISREREDFFVDADFIDKIKLTDHYTLIDSRAKIRYDGIEEPIDPIAGHIPGAINIPFMENVDENGLFLEKEDLRSKFNKSTNTEQTIFYCGSGVTACHNILARFHAGLGIAKLYPGSWSEWITDKSRAIE